MASKPTKTKTGKWEIRYREGSRNRGKTFTREKDAKDFKRDVETAHELGRPVLLRRDVPTLKEYAKGWQTKRINRDEVATNTILFDAALIDKHIDPLIGHLPLLDLTAARLSAWQDDAHRLGTPYMTKRATQLLGRILKGAVRDGYLPHNPVLDLDPVKHRSREGIALSPVQVERMRRWFLDRNRVGDACLVSVSAYVGPRPEEVLALRWENLAKRRLFIESKNVDGQLIAKHRTDKKGGARWAQVPEPVLAELASWKLSLGSPHGLIFPDSKGGAWKKNSRSHWRRSYFDKAAKAIGEEDLTPRDLRHTCASLMAAAGVPGIEIAENLGHRVDTSERIYQHVLEDLRGMRLSVDELILKARAEVSEGLRVVGGAS